MKRLMITILTVMAACLAAQAQYIGERPQRLERRGGHLYTENGSRIDIDIAHSIMNEESFQLYSSGRKLYKAGVIVSSIGGGFGAVGIVLFATSLGSLNTADSWVPYFLGTITSIPCLIIGGTMLLTSIPLLCVGNARLKKAAECYAPGTPASVSEVSIGIQQSGIGLGIRF